MSRRTRSSTKRRNAAAATTTGSTIVGTSRADDVDEDSIRRTELSIKRSLVSNATANETSVRDRVGPIDDDHYDVDDNDEEDDVDEEPSPDDRSDARWIERRRRERVEAPSDRNGDDDRDEAITSDPAVDDAGSGSGTSSSSYVSRQSFKVAKHRSVVPKVRGGAITSFVPRVNDCDDEGGARSLVAATAGDDGFVPPWVAYHVRAYMDVLFGAVALEKIRLVKQRNRRSEFAVPNVVDSVLRYNNIAFAAIEMCWVNGTNLVEPIWYEIDAFNNRLQLYISQPLYDAFCSRQSDDPVTMASGLVPIENYDPYATCPEASGPLDKATINCAIACDHVAQHIIVDVLRKRPAVPGADIHDRFTEVGCTLHSILDVTAITASDADRCNGNTVRDSSSYLTLLDSGDWRSRAYIGAGRTNAATASLYGSACPFGGSGDPAAGGSGLLRPDFDDDFGPGGDGSRFGAAYAFEESIA